MFLSITKKDKESQSSPLSNKTDINDMNVAGKKENNLALDGLGRQAVFDNVLALEKLNDTAN